jgi:HK97 family phage major capsid protein
LPVNQVDVMPSTTGVATKFIVIGNPKNMLFGQRRGLEAELSKEAVIQAGDNSILHNLYQEDKTAIRLTERVGFACALANRFVAIKTAAS